MAKECRTEFWRGENFMENSRSSPLSIQDMCVYEEAGERNLNGLERMVFSVCIGPGILPVLTSQTGKTQNSQDTEEYSERICLSNGIASPRFSSVPGWPNTLLKQDLKWSVWSNLHTPEQSAGTCVGIQKYLASNKVKNVLDQVTRYAKKQITVTHN